MLEPRLLLSAGGLDPVALDVSAMSFQLTLRDAGGDPLAGPVHPGDTFQVQVQIREDDAGSQGIGSFIMDIEFDAAVVTPVGYSAAVIGSPPWDTGFTQTAEGAGYLDNLGALPQGLNVLGDGSYVTAATITFQVRADATPGMTALLTMSPDQYGNPAALLVNSLNSGATVADANISFGQATLQVVANVTADAGGPYMINEGQALNLSGFSTNAGASPTYTWDLDHDGQYDDASGRTPAVPWSTLAGLGLASNGSALTIGMEVDDGTGGVATDTTTLTIANLAPTAEAGGPYTITLGQNLVLGGSGTDPGGDPLTYSWDLDGNGTYETSGATPVVANSILASLGLGVGSHTITLRASDGQASHADTATLTINHPPASAEAGGPYSISEGQGVNLAGSGTGSGSLTYAWDLDNDGQYDDATGSAPSLSWGQLQSLGLPSNGSAQTIRIRMTDSLSRTATDTATLTIQNLAPSAEAGGPYTITEGQGVTLAGSGSDPGGDSLTYSWDLDGNGSYETSGAGPTVPWATLTSLGLGVGSHTLRLQVSDGSVSATDTATLTIEAIPVTADAGGPYTLNEGQNVVLAGAGTGNGALTYDWDLDGDGQYDDASGATPTVTWSQLAALGLPTNGTARTIGLRVTAGGNSATDTTTLTIQNVAPTTDAGGPYAINEGSNLTLAGSGSDPGGDTLTYAWDLDNDGQYDDASTNAPTVSWATLRSLGLPSDGTPRTIAIRASDNQGGTATDTATLTISNLNPTTDAGGPYTINEGTGVTLIAAGSDPGSDTLTYNWDLDGDGQYDDAVGSSAGASWATLKALGLPSDGTPLTIAVQASDSQGGTATDTATLTINNRVPTVDAGPARTIQEGQPVTFSGSGNDVGDTLTFAWDLDGDGTFGDVTGATPTVPWALLSALGDGQHIVTLRASDDVTSVTDTTTLTIQNVAPTADAGGPYAIDEGQDVTLAGSGSDVGDDVLTYAWDLDNDGQYDDAVGDSPTVPWEALAALGINDSQYTIRVRVSDDHTSSTDTATLTVSNVPPQADAGGPYAINEGSNLTLAGSGSDPGDRVLTYAWDLDNDGQYDDATGDSPTVPWAILHSLGLNDGQHAITLRVSDDDTSVTDTTTLTIQNVAPTADAGGPYAIDEGQDVTLAGSGTDAGGDVLTYAWDLNNDGQYDDADGATPTVPWATLHSLGLNDGQHPIALRVSDGNTFTPASATLTLRNLPPETDAGGPYAIAQGQDLVLSAAAMDAGNDSLTFSWDLDNDGDFDENITGPNPTVPWAILQAIGLGTGTFSIIARAVDADGGADTDSADLTITVTGQVQHVFTANAAGPAGDPVSLDVMYDTGSADNTLAGLSVNLHYNSSELQFTGLDNVLATALTTPTATPATPRTDAADLDGVPTTDMMLTIAWSDAAAAWPGANLPTRLFTAGFILAADLPEGGTSTVHFTANDTAPGYQFQGDPATITARSHSLDLDGDGVASRATDGLLITRYLFGFTGDALVAGIPLDLDATRQDPAEIAAYLATGQQAMLDVDGNGHADALTDGILLLRYLRGDRGDQLTANNPFGAGATRTTATQIVTFLNSYLPTPAPTALTPAVPAPAAPASPAPVNLLAVAAAWQQQKADVHTIPAAPVPAWLKDMTGNRVRLLRLDL